MTRIGILSLFVSVGIASVAGAESVDPIEVLRKADDATKAVKAVSYQASFSATGDLSEYVPSVTGSVLARPAPKRGLIARILSEGQSMPRLRIDAAVTRPGSDEAVQIRAATDGQQAILINDSKKTYMRADGSDIRTLIQTAHRLYMIEFLHPTPFSDELRGRSAEYEGVEKVGDVDCDVVYVVYSAMGSPKSRWYFGREDHLPRRVDRIGGRGNTTLIVTDLDTAPDESDDEFALEAPDDFKKVERRAKARREVRSERRTGLLAVGTEAPNWELKGPDGDAVSLESLRGRVVVLDFWATWCVPCKMAMPGVQKLHEGFQGKPVKVFGVSTWDRGGGPAAYMKKKGFTYGLLLNGDDVAKRYNVVGIPTFYVIGADGKILHAESGIGQEKAIAKIIRENLPKSDL